MVKAWAVVNILFFALGLAYRSNISIYIYIYIYIYNSEPLLYGHTCLT